MYNEFMYNEQTYDGPHTLHVLALADSNTLADVLSPADVLKLLVDSLTLSETYASGVEQSLNDFIFLSEYLRIQFTEKILTDQVRLNEWFSIKKLFLERWHD